jgi:hypothetical protein
MSEPIIPSQAFALKDSDIHGETWVRLKKHLKGRIELLRAQNEGDLDDVATAKLRGRIAELRVLLALDKDT